MASSLGSLALGDDPYRRRCFLTDETIRILDIDDYDELVALWRRAELHSLKPRGRDSRQALARQLASGVQTILGLLLGSAWCGTEERLVGAVMVTHDSRKGWINRLAVDPCYRRRGYGERLIAAAERILHERGISVIAALVEGDNAASLALFQKGGYVDAGPSIHYLSKRQSEDA